MAHFVSVKVMRLQYWFRRDAKKTRASNNAGAVTAEFVMVIPAFLFLLATVMSLFALGVEQLRLNDVSQMSAKAVARGEEQAVIEHHAALIMDKDVAMSVGEENGWKYVKLRCQSRVLSLRLETTQKIRVFH